jgi:hypothetical protein
MIYSGVLQNFVGIHASKSEVIEEHEGKTYHSVDL